MSLASLFVNENDFRTLESVVNRILDTASQRAEGLMAEEGGIADEILGRVFNTINTLIGNGLTAKISHPAFKDPIIITLKKED